MQQLWMNLRCVIQTAIIFLLNTIKTVLLADTCTVTQYWDNGTNTCTSCEELCLTSQKLCSSRCTDYCERLGCNTPECPLPSSDTPLQVLVSILAVLVLLLTFIVIFTTCRYNLQFCNTDNDNEDHERLLAHSNRVCNDSCRERAREFLSLHNVPEDVIFQVTSSMIIKKKVNPITHNESNIDAELSGPGVRHTTTLSDEERLELQSSFADHMSSSQTQRRDVLAQSHHSPQLRPTSPGFSISSHKSRHSTHSTKSSQIPSPSHELPSMDLRSQDYFSSDVHPKSFNPNQPLVKATPTLDRAVENIRVGRSRLHGARVVHVTVYDDGLDVYIKKDPQADMDIIREQIQKIADLPPKRLRIRVDDPPSARSNDQTPQEISPTPNQNYPATQSIDQPPKKISSTPKSKPSDIVQQTNKPPSLTNPPPLHDSPKLSSVHEIPESHVSQEIIVQKSKIDENKEGPLTTDYRGGSSHFAASAAFYGSSDFQQEDQPTPPAFPPNLPVVPDADVPPLSSGVGSLPSLDVAIEQLRDRRYEVIGATVVHVTVFDNALEIYVRPHPIGWDPQSVHSQLAEITGLRLAQITVRNEPPPGKRE